jgi:multimeric flavodoxin WrbA
MANVNAPTRITAIVGTYRRGGAIDTAVDEMLAAAKDRGAAVEKVYLIDRHIEFCTNCRTCTQGEGRERGQCPTRDDMGVILDQIEQSDAFGLASPMNFWSVTAIMKRFMERLVCYAYWPWGSRAPKARNPGQTKRAVVVASSAAPSLMARLMTPMVGVLKKVARLLGARKVDVLFIGLVAGQERPDIGDRARRKARRLGRRLAERG